MSILTVIICHGCHNMMSLDNYNSLTTLLKHHLTIYKENYYQILYNIR